MVPIKQIAKNLGGVISKNSPQILTGLGCAGVVTTAILAVKATPKALRLVEDAIEFDSVAQEKYNRFGELPGLEKLKLTWKCYIPAGVVGITSIACIIGANTISTKRNAALAALYSLSEAAFREYQGKVVETIGKTKDRQIRDEVAKDKVLANPVGNHEVIFTGKGDVLCLDALTGRYFKSDIEKIRQSVNELNRDLLSEMWLSLNDLYYALDLPNTVLGDEMGWDIDRGLIELDYSSQLDEHGTPVLVISSKVYPRR